MKIEHLNFDDVSQRLELVRFIDPGLERIFITPKLNSFVFKDAKSAKTVAISCNQVETEQLLLQLRMVRKGETFTFEQSSSGLSIKILKVNKDMGFNEQHQLLELHKEIINHFLVINKKYH